MAFSLIERTAKAIAKESIDARRCFLCGEEPSSGAGEHVVPLWVQREFQLLDQKLTLLNGTTIPYRQLTIPCCTVCNNEYLAGLERHVQQVVASGEIANNADMIACSRWMAKILVGILVKETSLPVDRSAPDRGKIVPAEWLEEFRHCHLLLQSGIKTLKFTGFHGSPCSFYWYSIKDAGELDRFYISTNVAGQSVAIRLGKLAMAFVNDGGMQMEVGPYGPFKLSGATVTPIQFSELSARIHYKSGLRNATHEYLEAETDEQIDLTQIAVLPFSTIQLPDDYVRTFDDWKSVDFGQVASVITGLPMEAFYDAVSDRERTTLGGVLLNELLEGKAITMVPEGGDEANSRAGRRFVRRSMS